jgi:hypothetical protein
VLRTGTCFGAGALGGAFLYQVGFVVFTAIHFFGHRLVVLFLWVELQFVSAVASKAVAKMQCVYLQKGLEVTQLVVRVRIFDFATFVAE